MIFSLHVGLAWSGVPSVSLAALNRGSGVDVIAALMNFRVRIFIGVGRSQSGGR